MHWILRGMEAVLILLPVAWVMAALNLQRGPKPEKSAGVESMPGQDVTGNPSGNAHQRRLARRQQRRAASLPNA